MILMPPRHGKSFIASERFPVWHLGRFPGHQIVLTSYAQTLSDKFSKRARTLAQSPIMTETFPDFRLDADRQTIQEWETAAGGGYRAVGIGGGLTGMGADILIIDDPIKNAQEANSRLKRENDMEWYQTTAYTRLMPGAGVIVIQTRWHEDDLAGRLVKAMEVGEGDAWEVITYPAVAEKDEPRRKLGDALHPDRYDLKKLDRIKRAIGTKSWNALYQQRPSSAEGELFKRAWWKKFKEPPAVFERKIQSWDCNFKGGVGSDYVVGVVIGKIGADYYVLERRRAQWDFVQTTAEVQGMASATPDARPVLIEDAANGPAVISSLKGKVAGILPVTPHGSKESRATAVTPIVEAGNVYLPEGEPWVDEFIEEFAQFPKGANDDQVDALTQGVLYLEDPGQQSVFSGIPAMFGDPPAYPEGDWVAPGDKARQVFVGAKWGTPHTLFALGSNGKALGHETFLTWDHGEAIDRLRLFCRKVSAGGDVFVMFDATGVGESIAGFIERDTGTDWDTAPQKLTPVEVDRLINDLRTDLAAGKIKLAPWATLFGQLSTFRVRETDKGTLVYGPPAGLTANAVLALALSRAAKARFGTGAFEVGVIDQIETLARKNYYNGGFHEED